MQSVVKKTREVGFENVKDPCVKLQLLELVKAPKDATNFIFWYSKVKEGEWGLTIKSIPKPTEREGFASQHTWKITWVQKNVDGVDKLACARHCQSLAEDVVGDNYRRLCDIYKTYRNK
jgi:hypothetical protein